MKFPIFKWLTWTSRVNGHIGVKSLEVQFLSPKDVLNGEATRVLSGWNVCFFRFQPTIELFMANLTWTNPREFPNPFFGEGWLTAQTVPRASSSMKYWLFNMDPYVMSL